MVATRSTPPGYRLISHGRQQLGPFARAAIIGSQPHGFNQLVARKLLMNSLENPFQFIKAVVLENQLALTGS